MVICSPSKSKRVKVRRRRSHPPPVTETERREEDRDMPPLPQNNSLPPASSHIPAMSRYVCRKITQSGNGLLAGPCKYVAQKRSSGVNTEKYPRGICRQPCHATHWPAMEEKSEAEKSTEIELSLTIFGRPSLNLYLPPKTVQTWSNSAYFCTFFSFTFLG